MVRNCNNVASKKLIKTKKNKKPDSNAINFKNPYVIKYVIIETNMHKQKLKCDKLACNIFKKIKSFKGYNYVNIFNNIKV